MTARDGTVFVGTMDRGRPSGEGLLKKANGDTYEGAGVGRAPGSRPDTTPLRPGEFWRGLPCGRGRYTWSDGGFYEGDYKAVTAKGRYLHRHQLPSADGKRHGQG